MSLWVNIFGDKYEKKWYNNGKLLRSAFLDWQKNILSEVSQSKYINDFVDNNIYDCAYNDIKTLENTIEDAESKIGNLEDELVQSMSNISKIEDSITNEFSDKAKKLEIEYKVYISDNNSQIDTIRIAANDYSDYINSSQADIKNLVNKKVQELYDHIDHLSKEITSYFDKPKEIKEYEKIKISANNWLVENYTSSNFEDKIKNFWLLLMFLITIFFDYILWNSVMRDYLEVWKTQAKLWDFTWIAAWLLAVWFVMIIILFLHFAPNPFEESKDKKKQIWFALFFYIIIFVVFAYRIILSIPKWMTIAQWFWRDNNNLLELILRILLIPTVYLWEILLSKINRSSIIDIIKTPFRYIIIPFRYWNYLLSMFVTRVNIFFAKLNIVKEYEKSLKDRPSLETEINNSINLNQNISQTSQIVQNIKYIYENYQNKMNEFESKKLNLKKEINDEISIKTLDIRDKINEIKLGINWLRSDISSNKSYIWYITEQTRKWILKWLSN